MTFEEIKTLVESGGFSRHTGIEIVEAEDGKATGRIVLLPDPWKSHWISSRRMYFHPGRYRGRCGICDQWKDLYHPVFQHRFS